jgi:hypothetical protein
MTRPEAGVRLIGKQVITDHRAEGPPPILLLGVRQA